MAGFLKDRIVDLSDEENKELTCGICLEILNNPVAVQCCQQTYCKDCITEWVIENEYCHYDKKPLTKNGLENPSKLVLQMLAKLKIHCDHQELGCEDIVNLENVVQHSRNCEFNPLNKTTELCKYCGSLKSLIFKLEDEILRIKNDNESINSPEKFLSSIEQKTVLLARDWIKSKKEPKISSSRGFSSDLLKNVIKISREAIENNLTFKNISTSINIALKRWENGSRWHVIVHAQKCGESSVRPDIYYIDMSFEDIRIEIFSAGLLNVDSIEQKAVLSARDWLKSKNEPQIVTNKAFTKYFLDKVINISREAIEKNSTFQEISTNINRKLQSLNTEFQREHRWNVIVYAQKCGESLVYYDMYYVDMTFGDLRFEIFTGGIFA